MDPELRKQAEDIYRRAIEAGADTSRARRVANLFLSQQQQQGSAPIGEDRSDLLAASVDRSFTGGPPEPSRLEALGRGLAQGATLRGADEFVAGSRVRTTPGWGEEPAMMPGPRPEERGEAYREALAESQARDRAAREAHPGTMLAGELGGSIVPAVVGGMGALALRGGVGGATTAARAGSAAGRLAASGAGLGAAEGALGAEPGERVGGGVIGGVVGGTLALALPFIGKGLGRLGTALGLRARGAETRAADEILDALEAPPEQIRARLTETADETLMDVSPGARTLGETAALYPGAREPMEGFLERRARAQFPRVQGALEEGTGISRRGTARLSQEIAEQRAAAARPLYEEAYAQGQVQMTPELVEVLQKPSIRAAFERAQRIAAEEGVDLGEIGLAEGATSFRTPTVQALDYIKRGLDDVLYTGKQPQGGLGPAQLHAVRQTRRQFMDAVEDVTGGPEGAYAQARALYSGATAMQDALELGRSRFHLDPPDELAMILDDMAPGEVEMFRRGAVDNVLHRLGNVADRNDLMKRLVQSPNEVQRMALLFDDPQTYRSFLGRMGAMAEQGVTRDVVTRGSPTARRITGREALEGEGIGSSFSLRSLMDEFASGRRQGVAEGTAGELAGMLTRRDLPTLLDLLEGRAGARARGDLGGRSLARAGALGGVTLSDLFFGNEER